MLLLALDAPAGADVPELAVARAARPSVVRVRWRHERFSDRTTVRNAVVIGADGLLLMAGPPPSRRGSLTAILADGSELRARRVAVDGPTALTLLRVATTGLRPLELRQESTPAPPARVAPFAPRPLRLPPLGLRVVMVTGDGAVAFGPLRCLARYGTVTDPDTRDTTPTAGLLGAALAAVDADAGSPLLDAEGRIVGLMVGRLARAAPEKARAARRAGLALRPEPVEVAAVPAAMIAIVLPLLETLGRVPRAALGVTTEPVDDALRAHLGLEGSGHVVRRLQPGGAAEQAGFRLHDVIVSLNGLPVPPETSMHDLLLPFRPRTRVQVGVVRDRRRLILPLTLGER